MADDISDRVEPKQQADVGFAPPVAPTAIPHGGPQKPIPAAAQRALAEAQARRAEREQAALRAGEELPPEELQGRGGLDPVRYGDWEVKGIASDF